MKQTLLEAKMHRTCNCRLHCGRSASVSTLQKQALTPTITTVTSTQNASGYMSRHCNMLQIRPLSLTVTAVTSVTMKTEYIYVTAFPSPWISLPFPPLYTPPERLFLGGYSGSGGYNARVQLWAKGIALHRIVATSFWRWLQWL